MSLTSMKNKSFFCYVLKLYRHYLSLPRESNRFLQLVLSGFKLPQSINSPIIVTGAIVLSNQNLIRLFGNTFILQSDWLQDSTQRITHTYRHTDTSCDFIRCQFILSTSNQSTLTLSVMSSVNSLSLSLSLFLYLSLSLYI